MHAGKPELYESYMIMSQFCITLEETPFKHLNKEHVFILKSNVLFVFLYKI